MSAYTEIPKIIAETGALPPKVLGDLNSRYPGASSASVEYFVAPPPLGSDENDGSEDYPFATIAAAVGRIPDIIRAGHTITITLLPGEWDEDLTIYNRIILGNLTIQGSSGDCDRHKINQTHVRDVIGNLETYFVTTTTSGAGWHFHNASPNMFVSHCAAEGDPARNTDTGVHGLLADQGSNVQVRDSDFSNKRYGIRVNYQSRVHSHRNTGTNNNFGVGARWGGIMSLYGTQPEGNSAEVTTDSGGLVVHTAGGKIGFERREPDTTGHDELALVERHEIEGAEGRYPRKQWMGRPRNLHQFGNDIPHGGRLRLYFRTGTSVSYNFNMGVKINYVPISTSTPRTVHTEYTGMLTSTGFNTLLESNIFANSGSGGNSAEMIQVTHAGHGGEFYVDLVPTATEGARGGWYGIDIDFSVHRDMSAPTLYDAQILTS